MGSGGRLPLSLVRLSVRSCSAERPEGFPRQAQKGENMTFEEWLDGQPFRGVLFDGTIKMMHKAWDAGYKQCESDYAIIVPKEESGLRMRGEIYD